MSTLWLNAVMTDRNLSNPGKTDSLDAKYEQARNMVALMVPVKRACAYVGLNRSTYYQFLNKEKAPTSEQERGISTTDQAGQCPGSREASKSTPRSA